MTTWQGTIKRIRSTWRAVLARAGDGDTWDEPFLLADRGAGSTALLLCDPSARVLGWNGPLPGWFPELVATWQRGMPVEDAVAGLHDHAELLTPDGSPLREARDGDRVFLEPAQTWGRDPSSRPCLTVDTLALPGGGRMVLIADVTALRERDAIAHACVLRDATRDLASSFAHEINNQLQVISGCTELALTGMATGDRVHELLQEVGGAVRRLSRAVRHLRGRAGG